MIYLKSIHILAVKDHIEIAILNKNGWVDPFGGTFSEQEKEALYNVCTGKLSSIQLAYQTYLNLRVEVVFAK